tara:strand:- start:21979 stop:22683 length:705 start_codon:yes stop_codon:yes gene_type:complete
MTKLKITSLIKKKVIYLYQKAIKYREAESNGIIDVENYSNSFVYRKGLDQHSVVIDVGCAEDADLSEFMIDTYSVNCYGVDPTERHFPALKKLEKKWEGKFTHLPFAIGKNNEEITFYESLENQSGSLRDDHTNVLNDQINSYEVQCVTIPSLLEMHEISLVDYFKLDIEGAEYDLIDSLKEGDLDRVDQLFVEFHHHCIPEYNQVDTFSCVKRIESLGFKSFTYDNHNYLFFK